MGQRRNGFAHNIWCHIRDPIDLKCFADFLEVKVTTIVSFKALLLSFKNFIMSIIVLRRLIIFMLGSLIRFDSIFERGLEGLKTSRLNIFKGLHASD